MGEIYRIFGNPALTEKFLTVFGGTTIRIPSTKELEEEERNLAIYQTLMGSGSKSESRRLGKALCEHHGLTRREMRLLFKTTRRKLREAEKISESDQGVGKMRPKKVKVKRKNKRRQ